MWKLTLVVIALGTIAAQAVITNVQNVNLIEYYGAGSGGPQLLTTYSDTVSANPRYSFDGGYTAWANVNPGDKIRYALPQAVTVDKFYMYMGAYGGHPMEDFTIRYSATIDWTNANWNTLASSFTPSGAVTTASYTADIPDASVRYIELTVGSNCVAYNQMGEFMAIAPASATLDRGYNIMADPYANQSFHVGGNVWSPALVPENAALTAADGYWQVNFGSPKSFDVITLSWYQDQGNNNIKIYVSNDGVNFGSPIWTAANGTSFKEATFALQTAQYIRITADYAGGGAMNDVHVFQSIPEPATLALLGLGGLALIRRRRG
jgi:hypothetical protein